MGVGAEVINSRRQFRSGGRSATARAAARRGGLHASVGIGGSTCLRSPAWGCGGRWVFRACCGRWSGAAAAARLAGNDLHRQGWATSAMGLPEQERAFSLDGDPIKLARPSTTPLTTQECGAVSRRRCFAATLRGHLGRTGEGVQAEPALRVEVPLDARQEAALRKAHSAGPARHRAGDQLQAGRWSGARRTGRIDHRPVWLSRRIGPYPSFENGTAWYRSPEVVRSWKAEYEGRA